jgi:ATP-dependent HslUV protease ATP-binding subunit HslU
MAVKQERERDARHRSRAEDAAEDRVLDILVPPPRSAPTRLRTRPPPADNTARQVMRKRLREGALDDKESRSSRRAEAGARDHGPPGMEEMAEQLKGMFAKPAAKRKLRKLKIATR